MPVKGKRGCKTGRREKLSRDAGWAKPPPSSRGPLERGLSLGGPTWWGHDWASVLLLVGQSADTGCPQRVWPRTRQLPVAAVAADVTPDGWGNRSFLEGGLPSIGMCTCGATYSRSLGHGSSFH